MLRAGQQLVHIEQQHIQCLHIHGAAAEHGGDQAVLNALAHTLHDLLGGKGFAAEKLFHQLIVGFCNGLAHGLDQALETVADVRQVYLNLLATLVLEGLLAEQVDVHRVPSSSFAGTTQGQMVEPKRIFISSRILK